MEDGQKFIWREPVKITISLQEYPRASASVIRKITLREALEGASVLQPKTSQEEAPIILARLARRISQKET